MRLNNHISKGFPTGILLFGFAPFYLKYTSQFVFVQIDKNATVQNNKRLSGLSAKKAYFGNFVKCTSIHTGLIDFMKIERARRPGAKHPVWGCPKESINYYVERTFSLYTPKPAWHSRSINTGNANALTKSRPIQFKIYGREKGRRRQRRKIFTALKI